MKAAMAAANVASAGVTVLDDTVPAGLAGPDRVVRRFPGSSAGLMTRAYVSLIGFSHDAA
jgi:hypothetical protein